MRPAPYSPRFDFDRFLKDQIGKSLEDILQSTSAALSSAERQSYEIKGAVRNREMGSLEYTRALKNFLFYLQNGFPAAGVSPYEWRAYQPVIEPLVQKGQLPASWLDLFAR